MGWPGMVEYSAAVQNQRASFLVPELKSATVVPNRLGLPKVCSGAFAIVYELTDGTNRWAIRCFTKDVGDLQERYAAIAEHLRKVRLPYFVPFDYLKDGILVNGKPYPIMKMQWVDGMPLSRYVEQHLNNPERLLGLAAQFGELSADLERHKIGHGDLSAENVLMVGDTIRLIDYDGMYVPKLAGRNARELGNAAFQHPARDETLFGPEIDRFSVLLIATALAALAADPTLWKRHSGGNGLLFSPVDLRNPAGSSLFSALRGTPEATLRDLACELARWCEAKSPARLGKLPSLKRLKVKPTPVAAPSAAPATPGAAVPASPTPATVPAGRFWWRRNGPTAGASLQPSPSGPLPLALAPSPAAGPQPAPAPQSAAALGSAHAPAPASAPQPAPALRAVPAPRAAPGPGQGPAVLLAAVAAPGTGGVPIDWSGPFAAAIGLGFFCGIFAPETGSLSVLAYPIIMALVAWADIAAQRAAHLERNAPGAGGAGKARFDWSSVCTAAFGAGLFGVFFAPETGSLSMIALPAVPALVFALKWATAGALPAPQGSSTPSP